jgi:hypothetical protein
MESKPFDTYLFEYPYEGSKWIFYLQAESFEDAQKRLKALGWARLKGRSVARVPVSLGVAVKSEVWARNATNRILRFLFAGKFAA